MEKDLKDILLKDLCARIPYKVQASYYGSEEECETWDEIEGIDSSGHVEIGQYILPIEKIKPYLFPLSSMTEEQGKELEKIDPEFYSLICGNGDIYVSMDVRGYDWLNKNHFDYRGLIEKGLALDATGLNIY
jgi:hypothetical protein